MAKLGTRQSGTHLADDDHAARSDSIVKRPRRSRSGKIAVNIHVERTWAPRDCDVVPVIVEYIDVRVQGVRAGVNLGP